MYATIMIFAMIVSYFWARHTLDKREHMEPDSCACYLWSVWFSYSLRLQSVIVLAIGIYENLTQDFYLMDVLLVITFSFTMFASSFWSFKRSVLAWFAGTLLTLNPVFWVGNTLYFIKYRHCFQV